MEKKAAKKEQENRKKKNQEKVKASKKFIDNYNSIKQKKFKKNKNEGEKPIRKSDEEQKSSGFLWFAFVHVLVISVAIGFLYIVDYEKFIKVRLAINASVNKALSLLPAEVVTKGRKAFEYIRPFLESIGSKLGAVVGGVSAFLNTNPVVREHWTFVREIGSVCGGIFADYLRTLYMLTCQCWSKLLPSSAAKN